MAHKQSRVEALISDRVMSFERRLIGRGPDRIHTHLVEDLVVVRSCGVLTVFERSLLGVPGGAEIVRRSREILFDASGKEIARIVGEATGSAVLHAHSSLSIERYEWVYVIVLEEPGAGRREIRHVRQP